MFGLATWPIGPVEVFNPLTGSLGGGCMPVSVKIDRVIILLRAEGASGIFAGGSVLALSSPQHQHHRVK
jgi:hypothetical protein